MSQKFSNQTEFYNALDNSDRFDGYRITCRTSRETLGTVKFQHDNSVIVFWK